MKTKYSRSHSTITARQRRVDSYLYLVTVAAIYGCAIAVVLWS